MFRSLRPLALPFVLTAIGLSACGEGSGVRPSADDEMLSNGPVTGAVRGDFLYPDFQRWTIIKVKHVAGADVPLDLRGIPTILGGRSMYLSENYITFPDVNSGGDRLQPACFRKVANGVDVQPMTARPTPSLSLQFGTDDTLRLTMEKMFELTLKRSERSNDEGYQQRLFDSHYNERLAREKPNGAQGACVLRKVKLPPLQDHDLELVAADTGATIVVPSGDRDPWTPYTFSSLSHESRRPVSASDSAKVFAGCRGQQLVTRLMLGESAGTLSRSSHHIVRSLIGQAPDGSLCERMIFLRRIDPDTVLQLFNLPRPQAAYGQQLLRMDLVKWVADDVFVADIAGSRFEVTVRDQPQVLFSLKSAAVEQTPPRAATAAARTQTTPRSELDAPGTRTAPQPALVHPETTQEPIPPPAGLATGQKVHKWVAKDGTVTYSDRPPPN